MDILRTSQHYFSHRKSGKQGPTAVCGHFRSRREFPPKTTGFGGLNFLDKCLDKNLNDFPACFGPGPAELFFGACVKTLRREFSKAYAERAVKRKKI